MLNSKIFTPRASFRPYEYPELLEYVDAIRHSYWLHTEFNFTSDVGDFKTQITDKEREVLKRTMLAISQIEVAVKGFWGDIYKHLPKPEIGSVGATFAECEVRHADAYAHLLELLGLNDEFKNIMDVPVMRERYEYLSDTSRRAKDMDEKEYTKAIILFSLLVEHVSLFSQFLIMMSFNKYKNLFKGISNAVEATSKEEQVHGMFGIDLVNIIKEENPDLFDESTIKEMEDFCRDAYKVEEKVVDWIFEDGELEFLPKETVNEFIKDRLNRSMVAVGLGTPFVTDVNLLEQTDWFDTEVLATKHVDFFYKRSINYNKRGHSVTSNDLF